MMFSLSFVGGSKSASRFAPEGSMSASGFGPGGGPNLEGSKSAGTPAHQEETGDRSVQ